LVIGVHRADASGDLGQGDIGQFAFLADDQAIGFSLHKEFKGIIAEAGSQGSVEGRGSSAALDMAEDDGTAFQFGFGFDLVGQDCGDTTEPQRVGGILNDFLDNHFSAFGHGTFGDSDNTEAFSMPTALQDMVAY
jgi:hypothetical protein